MLRNLEVEASLDTIRGSPEENPDRPHGYDRKVKWRLEKIKGFEYVTTKYGPENCNYDRISKFRSWAGNTLLIFDWRKRHTYGPPFHVRMDSTKQPMKCCEEFINLCEYLRNRFSTTLNLGRVDVAIDLRSSYRNINREIKMGLMVKEKGSPYFIEKTRYFGRPRTDSQIADYSKSDQKGTDYFWHRIEFRMLTPRGLRRLELYGPEDLAANQEWEDILEHFGLYRIKKGKLIKLTGKRRSGEMIELPMWNIQDLLVQEFEVWPSNFWRDYVEEDSELMEAIGSALKRFHWCPDKGEHYQQYL